MVRVLALVVLGLAVSACVPLQMGEEPATAPPPAGEMPRVPPDALPEPVPVPAPLPAPVPTPEPELPAAPVYHPAGEALVEQARREAMLGSPALAGATLERALRIDSANPWIWIELGYLRLEAGQRAAAESLGRRALGLATRDPAARAEAGRLLQLAGAGP